MGSAKELECGSDIEAGQRLPWLRRSLSNKLADAVRRMAADKRSVNREVSLQRQSNSRRCVWKPGWRARRLRIAKWCRKSGSCS